MSVRQASVPLVLTFYRAWDTSPPARQPMGPPMGMPKHPSVRASCQTATRTVCGAVRVRAALVRSVVRSYGLASLK